MVGIISNSNISSAKAWECETTCASASKRKDIILPSITSIDDDIRAILERMGIIAKDGELRFRRTRKTVTILSYFNTRAETRRCNGLNEARNISR